MNFPSTNTDGRNPSAGGVLSNVESSHGVLLDGGSTGGIVTAAGDDANISLRVRGKGTGGLILGSTTVANSSAASPASLKGVYTGSFAWTHAAISSGQFGAITITSTTADIMPGDAIVAEVGVVPPVAYVGYRTSTAATSRVTFVLAVPGSSASSTLSGTATFTWWDLT